MNPVLLLQLAQMAQAAFEAYPAIMKEFQAIQAAASAKPEELVALNAQIASMDAARLASWKAADDALEAAAKT